MAALNNGVKPILSRQQVFCLAVVKTDVGNPPLIGNAQAGKVIEVHGLMSTVKVARADMNDTLLKGRSVVGWHVDPSRMQSQCGVPQRNAGRAALSGDSRQAVGITHCWPKLPVVTAVGLS
jgi:hypothetical protein